jgi:hypothetical protein
MGNTLIDTLKAGFLAACVCAGALGSTAAYAGTLTVLLNRSSLSNDADPDSNGLYQYEGGTVQNANGTATIGHYIVTRRVTTSGTSSDNTAGETITLFFPNSTSGNVPNNITIVGAYSYNTGQFAGSVSAVSARYRPLNGDDATAAITSTPGTTKLTIDFDGGSAIP